MNSPGSPLFLPPERAAPQRGEATSAAAPAPSGSPAHGAVAPPGATDIAVRRHAGLWADARRRLLRNRLAVLGGVVVLLLIFVAIFADRLAPYDPARQNYEAIQQGPSTRHPLGTDLLGRDVLSRLIYGTRVSITVGIFSQLIVLLIGVPVGAVAALAGGRIDNLLMRLTDIVYAFPDLLFIILLSTVLSQHPIKQVMGGMLVIFFAIGIVAWVSMARLVRGQLLSLREKEFVEAARALGASEARILWKHLLPNTLGPIIVALTFGIPGAIFAEAALSYIGIGITPPMPSWGAMVQDGYKAIFGSTHLVVAPAAAIALTMMAFTFLGDGLRDALDPRMK
jgi:oligopeptide transport system permease protein